MASDGFVDHHGCVCSSSDVVGITNGFDTSRHGVSEAFWQTWLERLPSWEPQGATRLVVVAPHPDDETLGAGGLIADWGAHGREVTVIAVTDGEAACPEVPGLAYLRDRERACALQALTGSRVDVVRLHVPDGRVTEWEGRLPQALAAHLGDASCLVAPFELDGHPDHDAVGRACRRLARDHGLTLARYPIWAWYRGCPELLGRIWSSPL